jgi:rubrerythrin
MNFNNSVLAIELENLQRRENEMYKVYSEMLKDLHDEEIKEKIRFIRKQELGHTKMVTNIISILFEYVRKG